MTHVHRPAAEYDVRDNDNILPLIELHQWVEN